MSPIWGSQADPNDKASADGIPWIKGSPPVRKPGDELPLDKDIVLEMNSVDGFSGKEWIGITEKTYYCHADRNLVRTGSSTNGTSTREVLLSSIPESVHTVGELVDYAKKQGVYFMYR